MHTTRWLVGAGLFLSLLLGLALSRQSLPLSQSWPSRFGGNPAVLTGPGEVRVIVPTRTGEPELCLSCHAGIEDISPSHAVEEVGCVACHGGDALALDAVQAHATLLGGRNPSDPSVVRATCGQPGCHAGDGEEEPDHVSRVLTSLPATYAGSIAAVRYTFGLQSSLEAEYGVYPVEAADATSAKAGVSGLCELPAAGQAFSMSGLYERNCLNDSCHLSSPARSETYYHRGTGCAACHYLYADDGLYRGDDPTVPTDEPGHGLAHRLTTAIPFSQCNHCHNRGTYSLKQMAFLPRDDLPPVAEALPEDLTPEERRLVESYQPIGDFTNCEWELDCVDCHTGLEAMGDGNIYCGKKDALEVQCRTCHGTLTEEPVVREVSDPDDQALLLARLNGRDDFLKVGDRVVLTILGNPMWSVKQVGPGEFVEIAKVSGEIYEVPMVVGSKCEQDGSSQAIDYCHRCHTATR